MLDRRKSDARKFVNYQLEVRKLEGKTTYKETFEDWTFPVQRFVKWKNKSEKGKYVYREN